MQAMFGKNFPTSSVSHEPPNKCNTVDVLHHRTRMSTHRHQKQSIECCSDPAFTSTMTTMDSYCTRLPFLRRNNSGHVWNEEAITTWHPAHFWTFRALVWDGILAALSSVGSPALSRMIDFLTRLLVDTFSSPSSRSPSPTYGHWWIPKPLRIMPLIHIPV